MRPAQTTVPSRHPGAPTAWTRVASEFLTRAESLGVARDALLARAGIDADALADDEGRLPLARLYALLEGMVELSRDPLMHMRVARSFEPSSLEALAFVVMTSETLGAGIRTMLEYQRLWSEGERYELAEERTRARLIYHPWGPPRPAHALMGEAFAVDFVVNGSALSGGPFADLRVMLAAKPPRDGDRHAALLGGVVAAFEQPESEVWFSRRDLDRPLAPAGQRPVRAFFERSLSARVRALPPASTTARARTALLRALPDEPALETLARRLHMSPRTLQRRLAYEGTTLRTLCRDTRKARAVELLSAGHAIAEVAYLLGYADASAFHHAFRRWMGGTPESFRRKARLR